jgi:hypothetical protein
VIWEQFEAAAPELAAVGRSQFEQSGVALIGTLRKDGSPRISCVEPCILDGVLYLGMMWQSRKALDLLQDPRLVLHKTVCTSTGDEVEFSLRGRAIEIRDPGVRRRYRSERTSWQEPYFHLFSLDIESASLVEYGAESRQSRSGHWAKSSGDRMASSTRALILARCSTRVCEKQIDCSSLGRGQPRSMTCSTSSRQLDSSCGLGKQMTY